MIREMRSHTRPEQSGRFLFPKNREKENGPHRRDGKTEGGFIMRNYYFTSESVTEGHPDKICDQISDGILDAIMKEDPNGRVACETSCTTGLVQVIGEVTTSCYVDVQKLVREIVLDIGYDNADYGFDGATCGVLTSIHEQSPDIALGVDNSAEVKAGEAEDQNGAGDQGMMFGYACDETPELMPMTIAYAHKLARQLTKVRKDKTLPYLRPDGKTQVTVRYEDGLPVEVTTVVVSTQHDPDVTQEKIHEDIKKYVIEPIIPAELRKNCKYLINPTGRFVVGGPHGDSGLTGRKIIVDSYGGWGSHGGGAFSGKDPTKVDRSAAYAARWVAKNLVAAGLCKRCLIQLAYAIGVAKPVSVCVDTYGTGTVADELLEQAVEATFDLRPSAIIRALDLRRPIYRKLAAYGHMGRTDLDVAWEKTDKTEKLNAYVQQHK